MSKVNFLIGFYENYFSEVLIFFFFDFSCGIYQTGNAALCQSIGIVLHYLFLSTLLWMTVSASNMYKRLSKADSLDTTPEDDLPPGAPIQKPILGLYLVGWGIGLIVCGISGAVNLKEYAGRKFCFLEFGPALSAVYVPAGMLFSFLILLYILTLCAIRNNDLNGQLSEGTQGTENVDLELLEVPPVLNATDRRSVQSIVTTDSDDIEDPEHSPIIQLKAHIIVLLLYCFICILAALSLVENIPNTFFYQQEICSILYCLLSFCLGAFILYFYCVARSDVRSQWTILKKVFKGQQFHCCRSRSVSDTRGNVQMTSSVNIPNGSNTRHTVSALSSSSVNSSALTAKSNSHNSNRIKAVKKLNNCDSLKEPMSVHSSTANNVNLVAMHRQMYRSNISVPNYREIIGPDCAEAFYNPRQSIVARKFFKKQRRNKRNDLGLRRRGDGGGTSEGEASQARRTWRPSAESAVFLSSDMEKNVNEEGDGNHFVYKCKLNSGNNHLPNERIKKSVSSKKNNGELMMSDNDGENKIPLDRLVIGAEEEMGGKLPVVKTNNGHVSSYDCCLSRVDELSASEDATFSPAISKDADKELLSENSAVGHSPCCDCNDLNNLSNYRNVELQCSLGENSCSDINSEMNYCECGVNVDSHYADDNGYNFSDKRNNVRHSNEHDNDDNSMISTDEVLNCDSFNKKIDEFNLNTDSQRFDDELLLYNKTDSSLNLNNSAQQCTNVLNVQLNNCNSVKNMSIQSECENEKESLINFNEINDKTKKETSV